MADALAKGDKLQALFSDGNYYQAEVVAVNKKKGKTPVKVAYNGYPGADAWLGLDSLKSKKLPKNAKATATMAKGKAAAAEPKVSYDYSGLGIGQRCQVDLEGTWYAAEVVTVAKGAKKAKAPVKVHYVGWDGADEWVGGDRIRSKALKKTAAPAAKAATKAAAAPAAGGYDYSAMAKGMRIQIELEGSWYAGEVVTVATGKARAKAPVKVKYAGYDGFDEWVGGDRIRSKALGKSKAAAPAKKGAAAPAAAAATKYDYSGLEKGMRLQVELTGTWYAANVVTVAKAKNKSKAPVKVNFAGYGPEFDEWVGGERIRSKALGKSVAAAAAPAKTAGKAAAATPAATKYDYSKLEKGMRLQVELAGTWYAANIVTVATAKNRAKAPVKVNYAGYGPENDEWVGGDRIRSKALGKAAETGPAKKAAAAPAKKGAVSAKAGNTKAAAPAAAKYDYSGLEKGMRLQVEAQGTWYAANVVTVKNKSKAPVKVNFAGYGPENDEWVGGDRIRSKALKSA